MPIYELLRAVAAARGGTVAVILDLPDGNEIACTSEVQAMMIERLWVAFQSPYEPELAASDGAGAGLAGNRKLIAFWRAPVRDPELSQAELSRQKRPHFVLQ